jgi:hypothetical protein
MAQHRQGVECFTRLVRGAGVGFIAGTHLQFLSAMKKQPLPEVQGQLLAITRTFDVYSLRLERLFSRRMP